MIWSICENRFNKSDYQKANRWLLQAILALCLTGMSISCGSLYAEESKPKSEAMLLTLDELITSVLKHSPQLQASLQSADMATAGVTTARAVPNPRLELHSGRHQASGISTPSGALSGVGVAQFIENPALRSARINTAMQTELSSLQNVAVTRNELVAETRRRAYEYLLRKEEQLAAADALNLLEQIRERVKVRVDSGEAGKYELIKADAEIINARQKEQTARLQVQQAAVSINKLAAGKLPPWELDAQLTDHVELPVLSAVKESALVNNPELALLSAELERARSRIEEAKASRWQGLELRVSQSREPEISQNAIGISIQLPLLDQRAGPRAEAIADRERALTQLEGRKAELMNEIELSWKSLEISRARIQALSEGAITQAESAVKVAQAAYRFGERGILDVLDAERVLRSVRADLLLARYQLQASLIELDTLAGRYSRNTN